MVLDSRSKLKNADANSLKGKPAIGKAQVISSAKLTSPASKTSGNPMGRWWEGLGLRTKTAIISVAAISLPLISLGTFTFFYVGQIIANDSKESKAVRAGGMANRTAIFMKNRYNEIETIALSPFFSNPKVQAVTTLSDRKAFLDNYIKTNQVYDSIALYRLDGTLIVDGGTEPSPPNAFKRDYFQEVLKTDKPVISQPEPSVVTKKVSIFVAAPVKDVITGKTIAVIRSRMPASSLENIYKDYIPAGEQYYLLGIDGKFFISLEKELIGRDIKNVFPDLVEPFETRKSGAFSGKDPVNLKPLFIGYAPLAQLEGLPDLKWEAVITKDEALALQPLRQFLLIFVGATSAVGILAVFLAIAISRQATKPILDATAAVSELGKGNLDTRLQVQGQDEMAQLGLNINSMAGQLQDFLQSQESRTRQSQILLQISSMQGLQTILEPLEQYLLEVRLELKCDRVVVYRFNPDWSGDITAEGSVSDFVSAKTEELGDSCISQELIEAYKNGRSVATNDVFNAGFHPEHLALMKRLDIKSNLVVPIFLVGELYGLLIAHHCANLHKWQEIEVELLNQRAFSIGQSLSRLASVERERIVAEQERLRSETIQRELIGLLSDVEGATQGDLTVRAKITAGEIGIVADFFNAIVESLREVVTQVKQATAKVNTSVGDNDIAIRGLADDATLQAQQLDDALQSVEKMTVSIQDVAKNAKQASDASSSAANTAELGSQAIERSAESILQLRQTVAETAKKVKRLGEASQQISKVVVLIDQIALKTNMLAVNASIEAAKAGEEGRGFAVVAEEVGALAAQSATATKEIERIVTTIQRETSEVVEAMEASTEQVVAGTQQVESARKSLAQIVQSSQKVNELFQSISGATVSQVQTSQAVKALMQNLATMSQKSSQTSRNVSEALQQTVDVASQLQASVETFKVDA